jgi:hypothetical protein
MGVDTTQSLGVLDDIMHVLQDALEAGDVYGDQIKSAGIVPKIMLGQICPGSLEQSIALLLVQGLPWLAPFPAGSGLDLHKDQAALLAANQIQLSLLDLPIAVQYLVAFALQKFPGQVFPGEAPP